MACLGTGRGALLMNIGWSIKLRLTRCSSPSCATTTDFLYLTPGLNRARKRERSGRWRASAPGLREVQGRAGTQCSSACSTILEPLAVWGLQCRSSLSLQLLLQLVEEAPIGPLRDDLLGTGLDHPGLVQPEGVEAHRILWLVLAPAVVRDLLQRLEGIVVPLGIAL